MCISSAHSTGVKRRHRGLGCHLSSMTCHLHLPLLQFLILTVMHGPGIAAGQATRLPGLPHYSEPPQELQEGYVQYMPSLLNPCPRLSGVPLVWP